jgi:tetratricopeptide (TPR) repeat protein
MALASYRRVTELEPDNSVGYENIGATYMYTGRFDEAIAALQQALERQPHYATYSNLGTVYYFKKQYEDAVKMYEKAVELNPNDEVLTGNLADAYRSSNQREKATATYNKAIGLARKALQVNPRDTGTLGSLALYHSKIGQSAEATANIRQARSIDSENVDLMYIEAKVHAQAGRNDAALQSLRDAFRNGHSTERAQNDPELLSLREEPRIQKLLAEFAKK